MFKKIPGNNEYSINLKEEIVDIYGNIVVLPIEPDGTIEIKLYGKTKNVKKSILKLLAWYEMGNIPDLRKHLDKILFCPVTDKCLRVISGYLPVFTTPVEYGNGFRIIPSYPRYAINIDGTILDTSSNTIVTNIIIDTDGYVSAYIRNPNKNGNRWTRVHRLMALAFLPNTDFITKPFVNHLNGVKSDYSLSNLEWCSAVENAQHAIDTGLTDTSIKMKTRDRYSGEVVIYRSAAELSKKLGLLGVGATKWSFRLPGYLYNKRYEIKSFEDNSPWYYEINTHEPTKAIFTITVVDKNTGEVTIYNKVRDFYKDFKLHVRANNLNDAIVFFKEKHPNHEVSYQRNSTVGPYRVLNIETNESLIFDSIKATAAYIEIHRTELQADLFRKLKYIYKNKWIVSIGNSDSKDIDISEYGIKLHKLKSVVVTMPDGREEIARSVAIASTITNVDRKTIFKRIKTGKPFKGFKFRALEQ